jgi:hypothetical protein
MKRFGAVFFCAFLVSCGGSGESQATDDPTQEVATEAADDASSQPDSSEPGGPGLWTPAQLCSLSDPEVVSVLFDGAPVEENEGIDSSDWTACVYKNPDVDPLSPESTLAVVASRAYDGGGFSEIAEVRQLVGADEAVFFADFDGSDAAFMVTKGDWLFEVTTPVGTAGAVEFAEPIAQAWLDAQAGG